MFKVETTDDALAHLKAVLEQEDENGIRIFQYSTGSPCCRKILLGVTPDEPDDLNDEVEAEYYGINFIVEEEVMDRYGKSFKISLDDKKLPLVVAE
ncbi:Uncharacterized protein YneR [Maridesulfovibrio ferrireducens]|uniref:Uncharacterized protein YneR n=1 Tax=Maridesulfovibrio ferrireducens TaxID=246191 RepID=A0A1G9ASV7_9BACT|nr:ErpA-related iron-sulfur cluster insertion protein [Maridesulfovibrio ferrireducens]SDK30399.1 Uncharacterized protein YneR [Maridesulfovibrio ferrireducens]